MSGAAVVAVPVNQMHLGTHLHSPLSEHGGQVGVALKILKGEDTATTQTVELAGELVQFMVMADGHGGKEAALHIKKHLVLHFQEAFAAAGAADASASSVSAPMQRAFARLHAEVCSWPGCSAGSTITVVLVNEARREIVSFNAGDSSAIVVDSARQTKMLTVDHRIDSNTEECQRLQTLGVHIARAKNDYAEPQGPLRAWPGGLAVARGIGDADCGTYVSPAPSTTIHTIPDGGCTICVASDGVWDAIGPGVIAKMVPRSMVGKNGCDRVAERIVAKAVQTRGLRDDTSCMLMITGLQALSPDAASGGGRFTLFRRSRSSGSSRTPSSSPSNSRHSSEPTSPYLSPAASSPAATPPITPNISRGAHLDGAEDWGLIGADNSPSRRINLTVRTLDQAPSNGSSNGSTCGGSSEISGGSSTEQGSELVPLQPAPESLDSSGSRAGPACREGHLPGGNVTTITPEHPVPCA